MNGKGVVTELKRLEIHDGPGIRSTIFVKGCPLHCRWCSNPETQNASPQIFFFAQRCAECGKCVKACPEAAIGMDKTRKIDRQKCTLCMLCVKACLNDALEITGTDATPEEIAEKLAQDRPFYARSKGGITISGGEPLSQPEFTLRLLKLCHEKGMTTCLDTCGYGKPEDVKRILPHVDMALLDIKHMDPVEHARWTGVSNEPILRNAELMARGCATRISLPLITGVNDSDENVRKTAEFTAGLGLEWIDVLPLHGLAQGKYEALGLRSPYSEFDEMTPDRVDRVIQIIESCGLKATRGRSIL